MVPCRCPDCHCCRIPPKGGQVVSTSEASGRTALVTEGTSDLGRVTARLLKQAGAQLIVSGKEAAAGRAAVNELGPGARFIAADLADLESVDHLARQVPVDILVNNADVVDVDALAGLYFLVAAIAPCMIRHGGGAIVNVASGTTGAPRSPVPGQQSSAPLVSASTPW